MTRVLLTLAGVPLAIWGPTWAAVLCLGMLAMVVAIRLLMRGHE